MTGKNNGNINLRGVRVDLSIRSDGKKCLRWRDLSMDEANDAIEDVNRKFGADLRKIGRGL